MINPFDKIVAPDPGRPEELGGSYECEVCFKTTERALYFADAELVIWTCPDGHKNKVENIAFND